jgi:hypothetical protein
MKIRVFGQFVTLAVVVVVGLLGMCAWGQDTPAPKLAPIIPDPEILKRTPVVDGIVSPGEWDGFQAFTADDWQVTSYINWDSKNLYLAVSSSKPCDTMLLVDANDDGWFHGEDNYEFRAIRQADGSLVKQVLRYESRNTTTIAPTQVSENEANQVEMKTTTANGITCIEWRIPEYLIRDFKLVDGKKIGLQIAARTGTDENSWIPDSVRADTKQCVKSTLVTRKWSALAPLVINFGIRDPKVARGEDITALLQLSNPGTANIDVKAITMAGDGASAEYLDSLQKRADGLAPKKVIKEDMQGSIPRSMRLGTWVVGTVVRSGDQKLGAALASFDVLDQFESELRLPKGEVTTNTGEVTVSVMIKNNMRKPLWGKVKVTLPLGWEFRRGIDMREYTIRTRNGESAVLFKVKPPIGALGIIPVKAEVTGADSKQILEGAFKVVTPR